MVALTADKSAAPCSVASFPIVVKLCSAKSIYSMQSNFEHKDGMQVATAADEPGMASNMFVKQRHAVIANCGLCSIFNISFCIRVGGMY